MSKQNDRRPAKRTYSITIDDSAETPFVTVSSTRDDNQIIVWAGPYDQLADPLLSGIQAIEEIERDEPEDD